MPTVETIIRDRAYLASIEGDADERARLLREIEFIAANAASKIERTTLEATE